MAIKCFAPECTEDVIGQCAGLENEPCGHFYCSKHSRGKLCGECVAVQEMRNLTQKYIEAAEWVLEPPGCGLAILYVILWAPVVAFISFRRWILGVACVVLYPIVIAILVSSRRNQRMRKKCEELYRFEEFYRMYKKYKNKDQLISMLIGTMEFASYMLSPEYSTASEIRRIRKRLE